MCPVEYYTFDCGILPLHRALYTRINIWRRARLKKERQADEDRKKKFKMRRKRKQSRAIGANFDVAIREFYESVHGVTKYRRGSRFK